MKKSFIKALACIIACTMILTIPSFAIDPQASDQIRAHWIVVTPTTGVINVEFSITGRNIMDKIGCQSIYIYEKTGAGWTLVDSKKENDYGMSKTNKSYHANLITFNGKADVEYEVVVTVFAENSAGRDGRAQTFYVTGK